MKEVWQKVKTVLLWVFGLAAGLFGMLFFLARKDKTDFEKDSDARKAADVIAKETEAEIEKKDAVELVSDSDNVAEHMGRIESEQSGFRKRVRDRFNKKL